MARVSRPSGFRRWRGVQQRRPSRLRRPRRRTGGATHRNQTRPDSHRAPRLGSGLRSQCGAGTRSRQPAGIRPRFLYHAVVHGPSVSSWPFRQAQPADAEQAARRVLDWPPGDTKDHMKFDISKTTDGVRLAIEGELDALTVSDLRGELDKLVDGAPVEVEVDLGHLRLIDSSGVGALVSLYKRVKAKGGTVEIKGLRDQPAAIFKLLRLDRVLVGPDGRALLRNQNPSKPKN